MSYTADLSKILFMMAEVYSTEISEPLVDAWSAVLQDEGITIEQAKKAAILTMKTRKYTKMPTPADFLEIVKPKVDHRLTAHEQADLVLDAVRRDGPYRSPEFDNPITAKLMKSRWPWHGFASTLDSDQVKWWRKEFVEAYEDYAKATPQLLLTEPDMKAAIEEHSEDSSEATKKAMKTIREFTENLKGSK